MGKPSSASKRARRLAKKKGLKVVGNVVKEEDNAEYSIDEVLDKAQGLIDEYNYEVAQKFCHRALEMDADNVRALEVTAGLLLESGQVESAKHCLGRSITVAPDSGHSKYMSLAQLMDGEEALSLYRKGIQLMVEKQQQSPLEGEATATEEESKDLFRFKGKASLGRELSSSYCAVAELFMTDLCDAEEAEAECGDCVRKAVEADGNNPEAWQTKARLHLVKSEFEDSKASISRSLGLWLPHYLAVLEGSEGAADSVEVCPLPYATRLSTVKILMELEMWDEAVQVLNGLTEEDESVVDVWYLLGLTNKLRADFEAGEGGKEEGEGYLGNARYYLKKSLRVQAKQPSGDKAMVEHIKELLQEVGPGSNGEQDNKSDEEEGWEDVDETDEEEESGEGMDAT